MASESGLEQLIPHIACFHKDQSWHLLHSKGLNDHNLYGLYSLYGYEIKYVRISRKYVHFNE